MKKKKLNILLNIATICLCVCAIAIGVYSAKNASLSVSGTIGFQANNCTVTITGNYKAYTLNNLATRTTTDITETTVGGSASSDISKTLPISDELLFSDLATDDHGNEIEFELTITNTSVFKISVSAPAPSLTTAVTGVTCASSDSTFTLAPKDTTGSSKTIKLTITVADIANASSISKNNFTIKLNFERYQPFYIASVTEKMYVNNAWTDVTTNKLCTTMGHSIVDSVDSSNGIVSTPIQWYAFAVKGESLGNDNYIYNNTFYTADDASAPKADRWYSLYGVDMSKVSYTSKTFWFIQQYVSIEEVYKTEDYLNGGMYFGNNNAVYANTEEQSAIFKYLQGADSSNSYLIETGISSESVFADISERSVNEIFSTLYNYTLDCVFTSKLWLLSVVELNLLANDSSSSGYVAKVFGINYPNGDVKGYASSWWLRELGDYASNIRYVYSDGSISDCDASADYHMGVRPAFQITI